MLEREHEHAVRRADREQVHHDGLRRQHDGAERAQQDQVGDHEHREDEPRERAVGLVDEVDAERGRAGHEHLGPGREPGRGHVALAQARDEVHRLLRPRVRAAGGPDLQDAAVGVDEVGLARERPVHERRRGDRLRLDRRVAAQLGDEAALGGDDRGSLHAPPGRWVSTTIWCGASAPAPSVVSSTCSPFVDSVVSGTPRLSPPVRCSENAGIASASMMPGGADEERDRAAHDRRREPVPHAGRLGRARGARARAGG